jgi:hypothetical protein
MGNVKVGKWEINENELERQHREALQRGVERVQTEPHARAVHFDEMTDRVVIELKNGVIAMVPRTLIQGLANVVAEDVSAVRLGPRGASLHWETLGVDFSLAGLLAGIFGTQAWMAEMDNPSSSPSATKASVTRARLLQE